MWSYRWVDSVPVTSCLTLGRSFCMWSLDSSCEGGRADNCGYLERLLCALHDCKKKPGMSKSFVNRRYNYYYL